MNLIFVNALAPTAAQAEDAGVEDWLREAIGGSGPAFARLVRLHQARVFSLALRISGRRDEAEELAQDAFMQLHANLARIGSAEHLRYWLCRTVTHRSIDQLRRRARQPQLVAENFSAEPAAEGDGSDPLLRRRLLQLLLQLPALARAVIVLRFQEDLDPTDIARTLDMPVNTVKSHLRRSLEWLRLQDLEPR